MELQEYKKRLSELKADYEKAKKELMLNYAKSNNPYKVGDIIKSGSTIIKIEGIRYIIGYDGNPTCQYSGTALKKDLTPRKVSPLYDSIVKYGDNIRKLG